jgi:hypothetical protein
MPQQWRSWSAHINLQKLNINKITEKWHFREMIMYNYAVDLVNSSLSIFLLPYSNPQVTESGDIPLRPSFCSLILLFPLDCFTRIVEFVENSDTAPLLVAISSIRLFLRRFGGTMELRNKFRREFSCFNDSGLVSL